MEHIGTNRYAFAKHHDTGVEIDIHEISNGSEPLVYVRTLSTNQRTEITSITYLSNNYIVTASKDTFLRFYDLNDIGRKSPVKVLPTIGIPLYKPVILIDSFFYIVKEAGGSIKLVEVSEQTKAEVNNPVTIIAPRNRPQSFPTCFAFVEIEGDTKLIVALDDGFLYITKKLKDTEILLPMFANPIGVGSYITDIKVTTDERIVIIYSSGHIFITNDTGNHTGGMFNLLYRSITDTNTGNNQLLILPGNIVAASFKRYSFPNPFPSNEQLAANSELVNQIACGIYMKLQPGGDVIPNDMRIWYGQREEIVGLSIIPQGYIDGDLSWISVSKDRGYMLHICKEPPPPLPPPPPPPPPPKPKPRGVNAAIQPENTGVNAEIQAKNTGVNAEIQAKNTGVNAEIQAKPRGVNAETQAKPRGVNAETQAKSTSVNAEIQAKNISVNAEIQTNKGVNVSTSPNINVSIQDIKILRGDKTTPYKLEIVAKEQNTIIRAKAEKKDTVAYVIPTIEERPGMKLQYLLDESNEGWIDTESGAQIPFNLIEGVNKMNLQAIFIKRNRLDPKNDPYNKNMQPVVKSYTIYILKPEDVYLENLQLFGRDRKSNLIRFNRNTLQYSVKVDKNTEIVLINPIAPIGKQFELTYLFGDESKPVKSDVPLKVFLKDGINTVTIKVKGVLGIEVEYKISITREGTGWWVPADMGLPTYQKTQKNKNRAKNIVREMRLANQTRRRVNANRASAEAREKANAEAKRIQRLKNARSGRLVTPLPSRPITPHPVTPVDALAPTPENQARLAALRAAQEERGRAAAAAAALASRPSTVFRPSSPPGTPYSGLARPLRPSSGRPGSSRSWRKGGSRKAHRRTRRGKSRRVRR